MNQQDRISAAEASISADEESIRAKVAITDRLLPDTPCKPARLIAYEKYLRTGKPWKAAAILYKRPICGARRKMGILCLASPAGPGRRRCCRHGGLSTGPRSEAGKQRIREGQYRRRERERAAKAAAVAVVAEAAARSAPGCAPKD